jgi:hypothetical protein
MLQFMLFRGGIRGDPSGSPPGLGASLTEEATRYCPA